MSSGSPASGWTPRPECFLKAGILVVHALRSGCSNRVGPFPRCRLHTRRRLLSELKSLPEAAGKVVPSGASTFRGIIRRSRPSRRATNASSTAQLNGHVERAQGSWRYEFYGVEDLPSRLKPLQLRIDAFAHRFNHTRPHQALGDLTPAEYLSIISQEIAPSHMG